MQLDILINPKGRKPTPHLTEDPGTTNKRLAIRAGRRLLRQQWAALPEHKEKNVVRLNVRHEGKLVYQARIDGLSALEGYRRMIVVEEE